MSGSYYTLDAKYNTLQSEINAILAGGVPGSQNLASVLAVGNSAGSTDINMNARNILACNNLNVTTINSAAYPPISGAGNLQAVLTAGNTATGTAASIILNNTTIGGAGNPQLNLTNSNATAGNTNGVPYMMFNKTGRNGAQNDIIGTTEYIARNYAGTIRSFGKIESVITNTALNNDDGALDFYTCVNGTSSLVWRLNGADNENNSFRPLDMNGQDLKSSSGNMGISTASSTGTGTLTLTPKSTSVVDIAGNATLTGTRQMTFGGGTNITDIISQTGLTITNQSASPDITQSIYQDANCNLVQISTPANSQYFNTNTPQNQTIRRMDLTSGNDVQKNLSDLVKTRLDYTDIATGDTSSIRLENDLASLNNVIGQNYTTGAGAVLETILQTTPYGQHRLSMTNNNTLFSTSLNTTQLNINDTTNNKSITIDNNPSSTQNRIDLFKNDGGGISTQLAVVNTTGLQTLALAHTDNANSKSIGIQNTRAGVGEISWANTIDSNPLNITSTTSLNLSSTNTITFTTGALTFTGGGLQSNTSGGNSGEHLVITLNGNQYKIALQNP